MISPASIKLEPLVKLMGISTLTFRVLSVFKIVVLILNYLVVN
uniref:Uncharacterized protein n=1 Tax=Salmonella sp. 96A-29192 TaxID=1179814 RepID=I3VZJ6_9ENTR|nr:hypothetical protein [Salmonella sp. 96A-29192]